MTEQELFDHYKTVYAFIRTECDAAEQSLAAIKNLAKSALPQQAALIDKPERNGYK